MYLLNLPIVWDLCERQLEIENKVFTKCKTQTIHIWSLQGMYMMKDYLVPF